MTGIEDIGESMLYLEAAHWNLQNAFTNANGSMSAEGSSMEQRPSSPNPFAELRNAQHSSAFSSLSPAANSVSVVEVDNNADGASCKSRADRLLQFNVDYRDKKYSVTLDDKSTVGTIKSQLASIIKGVPIDQMKLEGWNSSVNDRTILSSLHLPKYTSLLLLTSNLSSSNNNDPSSTHQQTSSFVARPPTPGNDSAEEMEHDDDDIEDLMRMFTIDVQDAEHDQLFALESEGSKTVGELKEQVFSLTGIPVEEQAYDNWPNGSLAQSDDVIALCKFDTPRHLLSVSRRKIGNSLIHNPIYPRLNRTISDESDDSPIIEDLNTSDEMAAGSSSPWINPNRVPLIPGDMNTPRESLENFSRVFESRFGDRHPHIFCGGLNELLEMVSQLPVKERKPVAIYIHNDQSISANVFCSTVLCSEQITNYINHNLLFWAWDVTDAENREKFLRMCQSFLSIPTSTFKMIPQDMYPLLLVVQKVKGAYSVLSLIKGNLSADEVFQNLLTAVEEYDQNNISEIAEETDRNRTQQLRRDQNKAYEDSLLADQQKQVEKEEFERLQQLAENRQRQQEQHKEDERSRLERLVPDEPSEDLNEGVTTLNIRFPDAPAVTRRFLASDPVRHLVNFISSIGYSALEYKIMTTFPKKDVTAADLSASFASLELFPRVALIVEQRIHKDD